MEERGLFIGEERAAPLGGAPAPRRRSSSSSWW
jgi:hypothetical protein